MKRLLLFIPTLIGVICLFGQKPAVTRMLNHGIGQKQDSSMLPLSKSKSEPKLSQSPLTFNKSSLEQVGPNNFRLINGWMMQSAEEIEKTGILPMLANYDTRKWHVATVPGTILTTLVKQGIYPDPYYSINNLSTPDDLCRQEWWYRVEVEIPRHKQDCRAILVLNGINYRAQVWFNQKKVGTIAGAFIRGRFDVTDLINKDKPNVLAIKIIPPEFPGYGHEESVAAGMGPNGGLLCLSGPTFYASEGWDWIPSIRDRNMGIWQDVCFEFPGSLSVGDAQIITDLPLSDTTSVDLTFRIPVRNLSSSAQKGRLNVEWDGRAVSIDISLKAGESKTFEFTPATHPEMKMKNPKLWWPNGMGEQNLYTANFTVTDQNGKSDVKESRFGVREYDYMLCVSDDTKEHIDIELNPTAAYKSGKQLLDQINVIKSEVNGKLNYLPRFIGNLDTDGVKRAKYSTSPYMVVKINGVKVFCKGGNWGMDDAMKRVSRERLEPYFKLQKDQNFNMLRNWCGQSTEEVFYELCDEYGIMVFNDFWMSTTNYNVPPADNELWMRNATDMVKRYRNHPSIAVWCSRNEGFAPDLIEPKLTDLLIKEDGTRHYLSSSINSNTTDSGPWNSNDPDLYGDPSSTLYAHGFKTEIGTASIPTFSTVSKFIPSEDLWPTNDVWSYHDWHVGGWLKFAGFEERLNTLYGKMTGAEEFCNWSQIENYRAWRAICEAWQSRMWNDASGFLLWMSHPSWPSTVWQTYTYDYETPGAYFGCKKASEPLHIQYIPAQRKIQALNSSRKAGDFMVIYTIYGINGKKLSTESKRISVAETSLEDCFTLDKNAAQGHEVALLRLEMKDKTGKTVSLNDYWLQGEGVKDMKSLRGLQKADVRIGKVSKLGDGRYSVEVSNKSANIALAIKLNLKDKNSGEYILPALFSDGYFNLLPEQKREIILSDVVVDKGKEVILEYLNK